MRKFLMLVGLAALAGCTDTTATNPATATTQKLAQEHNHDDGHEHARD